VLQRGSSARTLHSLSFFFALRPYAEFLWRRGPFFRGFTHPSSIITPLFLREIRIVRCLPFDRKGFAELPDDFVFFFFSLVEVLVTQKLFSYPFPRVCNAAAFPVSPHVSGADAKWCWKEFLFFAVFPTFWSIYSPAGVIKAGAEGEGSIKRRFPLLQFLASPLVFPPTPFRAVPSDEVV